MRKLFTILLLLFALNVDLDAQSVSITSSSTGSICAGTNIIFTATTSGISTPTFQWYKNSVAITGATSSTYSTTSLSNNDQIYVTATPGYSSGSISTTGLIANFDAANYNATSTRWNDLSPTGNHMDFYTSNTYSTLKTANYLSDGGGSLNLINNSVYGKTINNTGITGNGGKTITTWIKFDAADRDWTSIVSIGAYDNYAVLFELFGSRNGSGYQVMLVFDGGLVPGATIIPLNTWANVTIKADGSSLKVFVNGILDASGTQTLNTTNSPLYLGTPFDYNHGGWNDNLRGRMSTLSLYNTALSDQTILDNYNATKGRYLSSTSYNSNSITNSILASPNIPVLTTSGDGCINKTTLTTATGLSAYQWYKDNLAISGATSNTYTPSASGLYQVQVSNGTCSNTSTATTIYNCAVDTYGRSVATFNLNSIISPEGGANFGTARDFSGKLYNTTSFTTTSGTIGSTSAILGGVISSTNAITSSIGIIYSTDASFGTYSTTTIQSNVAAGTYTSTISGLSSGTNYFTKSFIVNKAGTSYGPVINFTTSVPSIVTQGLVLNLDAGNNSSYPSTGTTWTDLSGRSNNGSLVNTVTYNSSNQGYLVFNGYENGIGPNPYVLLPTNSDFDFGTGDFTVDMWVNIKTVNDHPNFLSINVNQSSNFAALRMSYYQGNLGISHSYDNANWAAQKSIPIATNTWKNVVVSRISGQVTVYIDAISNLTYSLSGSLMDSQQNLIGTLSSSFTPIGFFNLSGNIAATKIYKGKGLTSDEVSTQFSLLKTRFGL
jgi:hypothetical protein